MFREKLQVLQRWKEQPFAYIIWNNIIQNFTGFIWMTANTFRIFQSNISKLIVKVFQTITCDLGPELEHLPSEDDEIW